MQINELEPRKVITEDAESFFFMGREWDVDKGFEIVKAKSIQPEEFNVSDLATYLGFVRVDKDYALNTTKTSPVLLITLPQGLLMIDGYHRVYQAKHNGVETISGYVLNQEDSKSIEME